MYKVVSGMSLEIMNDVFKLRDETHHPKLGPKVCEQIPTEIKNKDSLVGFKKEITK